MYQFKLNVPKEKHDAFVASHSLCNLLQSSSWAEVKDNWESMLAGVYDDGELVASALVLIKSLPMGFTMMYIPRGPIMDYDNERLLKYFFQELKKWAKTKHCLFIKCDPGIHVGDYKLDGPIGDHYENIDTLISSMKDAGLIHSGFTMDMDATIQPRFHANVYADEFVEDNFTKSCKKMLKIARKKQVDVNLYGIEKVDVFSRIMQSTVDRKQIALRDESYFKQMLKTYGEDAFLVLASLNLKKMFEEIKADYENNEKALENCPENAVKKRFTLEERKVSLERELLELKENMKQDGDVAYIAGALTVVFGDTSEILYAGMDVRYKRYMAPYVTWLKAFEESFQRGCRWCNMGGIENDLKGGLTSFKRNFNPCINEFIGEFDLPVNKTLYTLSEVAYRIRKQIKAKK